MIHHDRDRLLYSAGIAVVLHAILFVVLAIIGPDFTPYPETRPVYVTLPDYDPPEERTEEPEPAEAEPEPVADPELAAPEPAEPEPAEPEPVADPEPAEPAPVEPTPEPASPSASAPAPREAETAGRDAPPGSFSQDDLRWLNDDASDREAARPSDDELFGVDEPDRTDADLPSWVTEGEFSLQPESSLDADARETLETKREAVPGFADRLSELTEALENPPGPAASDSESGSADSAAGPDTATTALPGGGSIEWMGSGTRQMIGEPAMPRLTAADFGGQVPARISYLIVFEVNQDGLVVPGSLIFRQSSGYTLADQKVRRAVSRWRFDPAPGFPSVTAIATLHISRDQIR